MIGLEYRQRFEIKYIPSPGGQPGTKGWALVSVEPECSQIGLPTESRYTTSTG